MVGGVADHDQPVAGAGGPNDRTAVEVAAGHGAATLELHHSAGRCFPKVKEDLLQPCQLPSTMLLI